MQYILDYIFKSVEIIMAKEDDYSCLLKFVIFCTVKSKDVLV